jgi:hypothetical protein
MDGAARQADRQGQRRSIHDRPEPQARQQPRDGHREDDKADRAVNIEPRGIVIEQLGVRMQQPEHERRRHEQRRDPVEANHHSVALSPHAGEWPARRSAFNR